MSDFFGIDTELSLDLNGVQPVTEDFSTDGLMDQWSRVDHQHPLSESLRAAIFSSTLYVKKSGDTMTGSLIMASGAHIYLASGYATYYNYPTNTNLIYTITAPSGMPWHSGLRLQTIDGFSIYNNVVASDVMGYRGASGTGYLWVGNKALIGKTPSDADAYYALNVNGHIGMLGSGAIIWPTLYNAACIWMQDGTWVRVQPNFYTGGICGGNSGISAGGAGGGMAGYTGLYCPGSAGFGTTVVAPRFQASNQGGNWANSGLATVVGVAGTASWALHNGYTAPVCGTTNGTGNNQYFRDAAFNANTSNIVCAGVIADSSQRWKKNINTWPLLAVGAGTERVTDLVAKLRPVTYENKVPDFDVPSLRRWNAWERLNKIRANKGQARYEFPAHDCSESGCPGSIDDPCSRKLMIERERLGFIAEELYEVFPHAVSLDAEKLPEGIDMMQLITISIAAIQELTERINHLEKVA